MFSLKLNLEIILFSYSMTFNSKESRLLLVLSAFFVANTIISEFIGVKEYVLRTEDLSERLSISESELEKHFLFLGYK